MLININANNSNLNIDYFYFHIIRSIYCYNYGMFELLIKLYLNASITDSHALYNFYNVIIMANECFYRYHQTNKNIVHDMNSISIKMLQIIMTYDIMPILNNGRHNHINILLNDFIDQTRKDYVKNTNKIIVNFTLFPISLINTILTFIF